MNIKVVGSSSKGNCYIINNELILDAGMSFKDIQIACNFNFIGKTAFITHEHKDHSLSVEKLTEYSVVVYMSKGTKETLGLKHHNIKTIPALKQFKVGNYTIMPFDVQHDAAEPLGFLICDSRTGEKLLFATDTYFIKYKFDKVDYFLLECNYSEKIVEKELENGSLNPALAKRLLTSHFSLENVIIFLKGLDLKYTKLVMLIHLSDNNSDAESFCREIEKEIAVETAALNKGNNVELIKL